jgi:hypothetical protein
MPGEKSALRPQEVKRVPLRFTQLLAFREWELFRPCWLGDNCALHSDEHSALALSSRFGAALELERMAMTREINQRNMNFDVLPSFYIAWTRNCVERHIWDPELIDGLTVVRDEHEYIVKFYDRTLDKFDRDGTREGREQVIAQFKDARNHCREVVEVASNALDRLRTFDS